jgi:hypothetical protein
MHESTGSGAGDRAHRAEPLSGGHLKGAGSLSVGALYDDRLNALMRLDGEQEAALYIVSVDKV